MLEVYMIQGLCEHRIHFENIIEDIMQQIHVQDKDQDNKHFEEGENPLSWNVFYSCTKSKSI